MTLRDRRVALDLSQAELAAELGVTRLTIVRLEKKPELPRLYDLALSALETSRGRNPRDSQRP